MGLTRRIPAVSHPDPDSWSPAGQAVSLAARTRAAQRCGVSMQQTENLVIDMSSWSSSLRILVAVLLLASTGPALGGPALLSGRTQPPRHRRRRFRRQPAAGSRRGQRRRPVGDPQPAPAAVAAAGAALGRREPGHAANSLVAGDFEWRRRRRPGRRPTAVLRSSTATATALTARRPQRRPASRPIAVEDGQPKSNVAVYLAGSGGSSPGRPNRSASARARWSPPTSTATDGPTWPLPTSATSPTPPGSAC